MLRLNESDWLQEMLASHNLDPKSEQGQIVRAWLLAELSTSPPTGWARELPRAIEAGRSLYDHFVAEFSEVFLTEEGLGEVWVRRALRRLFGFAAEPVIEKVLNRIRDRRCHLLQSAKTKYQKSLFAPWTFQPDRIKGYLRQVARVESRKAPLREIARLALVDPTTLEGLGQASFATTEESAFDFLLEPPVGEEEYDLARRMRQVEEFWSAPTHGFRPAHRLEGLMSLGQGKLTGHERLASRCRAYLLGRIEAWTKRQEHLTECVGRLLDHQGDLEAELLQARDDDEREEVKGKLHGVDARLARLRLRLRDHQTRLLPRPHEVQDLLRGIVDQKIGTLRFQRIGLEIAVFRARVEATARKLAPLLPGTPPEIPSLFEDVKAHRQREAHSPGTHGLDQQERARRRREREDWRREGDQLLVRVRRLLEGLAHAPLASSPTTNAILDWLSDVQDLYELGLLERLGLVEGLRRRRGGRLDRLLRPPLECAIRRTPAVGTRATIPGAQTGVS